MEGAEGGLGQFTAFHQTTVIFLIIESAVVFCTILLVTYPAKLCKNEMPIRCGTTAKATKPTATSTCSAGTNAIWRFGSAQRPNEPKIPYRADLAYNTERNVAVSPMAILNLEF